MPHTANARRHPLRTARGLTLVECLTALSLLCMLISGSWHALRSLPGQVSLHQVASVLETDLKYARSLALLHNAPVRWTLSTLPNGGTCYVIHSGPSGACTCQADARGQGQAVCAPGAQSWRVQLQAPERQVQLSHTGRSLVFDPDKGTLTPTATIRVVAASGEAIHQITNLLGRTRSCSPTRLAGLPAC